MLKLSNEYHLHVLCYYLHNFCLHSDALDTKNAACEASVPGAGSDETTTYCLYFNKKVHRVLTTIDLTL